MAHGVGVGLSAYVNMQTSEAKSLKATIVM